MTTITVPTARQRIAPSLTSPAGGLAYPGAIALAAAGVLQATGLHWGHKMLVQTFAQHLEMGLVAAGMLCTLPLVVAVGRRTGGTAAKAAWSVVAGQVLIAAITTQSNIVGHDAKAFNALAGVGMLLWVPALIVTAVGAARRRVLSATPAVALVVTLLATIPMASVGGGLLAAGCWALVARQSSRPAR